MAYDTLLIATGNCNAQTGIGDPYLPFRELLGLLTGDLGAQVRQDAVNTENAGRVGRFLKVSRRVISDLGPDLVDILVPGVGIATKVGKLVADDTGLLNKMGLAQAPDPSPELHALANADQARIFEQYTAVLRALSHERPLVLVLDDLQWIDESSASLLFHLARRIGGSRILVIASFRPEDVALGRGDLRHPLAPVLAELKREFGDVEIPLGDGYEGTAREFVDALLDWEPNQLGESFRQALARRTHGHPLFTAELLRAMRERGDLARNADGHAQRLSGAWSDSMSTIREAAAIAELARLPEATAEAALGYEHPRYRYNLPAGTARDLLGRALAALPARDSSLRVRVLAGLARATATTSTGPRDPPPSRNDGGDARPRAPAVRQAPAARHPRDAVHGPHGTRPA